MRRPIEADNVAGYLARHITETPRLPSLIDSNVPPHLETICMHLLKKEPSQRPRSAREVLSQLDGSIEPPARELFGREKEMEWLLQHLHRVRRGAGGMVLVSGELGSGRTALLESFVDEASRTDITVAAASGARSELVGQLARQLPHQAAGGASWVGLGTAAALQPTIMVVDDIDHMDESNRQGMMTLLRQQVAIQGMPILVVASIDGTSVQGSALKKWGGYWVDSGRVAFGWIGASCCDFTGAGTRRHRGCGCGFGSSIDRRIGGYA